MTEQTKNEYTDEGKLADAGIGITAGSIFILIMLGKPLNKHFDTIGAKIWTGFFVSCMVIGIVLMIVYRDDLPPRENTDNQRLADAGITFTVLGVLGGLFLLFVKIINKWLYAIPLLLIIIGIIGIVLMIVYRDDLPPRKEKEK
jgi:hypothetical protein